MKKLTYRSVPMSVFLGLVVFLQACSGDPKSVPPATAEAPVAVVVAQPGSFASRYTIMASGQVEAVQTANISTRVMGFVTNMYVNVGDRVKKGQVLATISDQDIQAKKAQAQAMVLESEQALKSAQRDYERYTALYAQQSASAKELDNVTLHYRSMQSKVEAARQLRNEVNAMLTYARLTAPFSGVVTRKNSSVGDMASPGEPLYVIEQGGTYQVRASVPEHEINKLKLGASALVDIKSTGQRIRGKVTEMNPSSRFTGGQYEVKISIPGSEGSGLYAGMYTHVSIPVESASRYPGAAEDKVLVPVKSIITRDQLSGLYTVSSNKTALLRWVRLGRQYGDQVEVLSGLGKEEPFVVQAEGRLFNGVPLAIKNQGL